MSTQDGNNNNNKPRTTSLPPPSSSSAPIELLPEELLWAAGGHASDIVLTAMADGQNAIVPGSVRLHVERCSNCMTHLGNAALLSLHTDRQLAVRAEHDRALATQKRPLPRLAIALGLLVALVGLVPTFVEDASSVRSFVTRDVPLFLHGLRTLAHRLTESGSSAGLFITYAAAFVLVGMGIAAIRILPKKETSR
jgi:hypothetical protein